jgi:recombinational DNA repair protein RecT
MEKITQFCERYGLSCDPVAGHVFIKGDQVEITFKGLVYLMYRTDLITNIHCDVVTKNDEFKSGYKDGNPFLEHIKTGISGGLMRSEDYQGFAIADIAGSYAIAHGNNQSINCATINQSEIIAIVPKNLSPHSPWYKFPGEMAKKMALKRLAKMILLKTTKAPDDVNTLMTVIDEDDEQFRKKPS